MGRNSMRSLGKSLFRCTHSLSLNPMGVFVFWQKIKGEGSTTSSALCSPRLGKTTEQGLWNSSLLLPTLNFCCFLSVLLFPNLSMFLSKMFVSFQCQASIRSKQGKEAQKQHIPSWQIPRVAYFKWRTNNSTSSLLCSPPALSRGLSWITKLNRTSERCRHFKPWVSASLLCSVQGNRLV